MGEGDVPALVRELVRQPCETEWVEFKRNVAEPERIGRYLSALSNSAALHARSRGYVVWGVENETHNLVGSSFRPRKAKVGGEELENWLARQLYPRIHFAIHEVTIDGKHLVVFEVHAAEHTRGALRAGGIP